MSDITKTLSAIANGNLLGEFIKCSICKEYDWSNIHQCKPIWEARFEAYEEDDAMHVYAIDAEIAALAFSQQQWDFESSSMQLICVRRYPSDDDWELYEITVEAVPSFTVEHKGTRPRREEKQS